MVISIQITTTKDNQMRKF